MERPRLAGARGKSPEGGILDRARERESPLPPSTEMASRGVSVSLVFVIGIANQSGPHFFSIVISVREAAECLSSQRTTTVAALEKELSVARLQVG